MSKKSKLCDEQMASPARERIAIFYKTFTRIIPMAPHLNVQTYKKWEAGTTCRDESLIDELIKLNAPVEVFYRDVN